MLSWQASSLENYLERWSLAPEGEAIVTPSSWLQPVTSRRGKAMLKVARNRVEGLGGKLLSWWNGDGAAPVWRHDSHAILLPYAEGSRSLAELSPGDDSEATRILCDVAARLHAVSARQTPPDGLIPLHAWFAELLESPPHGHDSDFIARGATTARRLLSVPAPQIALHGDLHHGNVLDFGTRGWLAIDPKFILGPRQFDYANILCNPTAAIAESRVERRVEQIAQHAAMSERDLLEWTVAWTALSALWFAEDGNREDSARVIRIGERAEAMLHA